MTDTTTATPTFDTDIAQYFYDRFSDTGVADWPGVVESIPDDEEMRSKFALFFGYPLHYSDDFGELEREVEDVAEYFEELNSALDRAQRWQEAFEEWLDEQEPVLICGMSFSASRILRDYDEPAYSEAFSGYVEGEVDDSIREPAQMLSKALDRFISILQDVGAITNDDTKKLRKALRGIIQQTLLTGNPGADIEAREAVEFELGG